MGDLLQRTGTRDRPLQMMVGFCAAVLLVAVLYVARTVFEPFAFALFIIAIVWPFQAWLQKRLPRLLALAISISATIVAVAAFASILAWGSSRAGRYIVSDAARFQLSYSQMAAWLEGHGIIVARLWVEHFNVSWLARLFQQITARISDTLSFSIVVLIYVILGLLEIDTIALKLRRIDSGNIGKTLLTGCARTAGKLRIYLLVRSLMSVVTGILVWGFISVCGLPLAAEWGAIAFALNFIPFVGPFIATLLPTLFEVAQSKDWQMVLLVFGCLNLIQFLVGSYLEPRVTGSVLSISPFMMLLAFFFWSFLWGIVGAFLGIPILILILTVCEEGGSSRWVAELFGD